ncbi:MAG: hypothetical protein QG588_62 [Candidatus Poribacteria bacterium]|nr:hypothetical protein [Candidatus Poribacteria bacterium]
MKVTKFFLAMIIVLGISLSSTAYGKVLWMDTFDDGTINSAYLFKSNPGAWVQDGGIISQTNPIPGDTCYLIYPGKLNEPFAAIVKIRIDGWEDHDYSRAGMGFRLTEDSGQGYAFLIHQTLNNVEYLNDALAWKNNDTVPPFGEVEIGKWYWMKAEISADGLKGKIWSDGEDEPADWLLNSAFDFGAVRDASGNVGLNGGSSGEGRGQDFVSFDNWAVCESADECVTSAFTTSSVGSSGKLSNTWGGIKLSY